MALGMLGWSATFFWPPSVSQEAIQTSVTRTPTLTEQAWRLPVASSFQGQIAWQSNASLCGPASLANVFRSFGDETATEDTVLAGRGKCWTGFCIMGLTLDELAELAKEKTDRKVSVLRDLTPEQFLEHLHRSNDLSRRYVINFSRASIFGSGTGHHSPIGGYLEAEDLVLVLDVNSKFQPWLIERSRLFSAMDAFDGDKKRGLVLIEDVKATR
jgi:hypothetical protein